MKIKDSIPEISLFLVLCNISIKSFKKEKRNSHGPTSFPGKTKRIPNWTSNKTERQTDKINPQQRIWASVSWYRILICEMLWIKIRRKETTSFFSPITYFWTHLLDPCKKELDQSKRKFYQAHASSCQGNNKQSLPTCAYLRVFSARVLLQACMRIFVTSSNGFQIA